MARVELRVRDAVDSVVFVPRRHVSSLRFRICSVVNREVPDAMLRVYGAVADERRGLGVIPSALVTRDGRVIAQGLAVARGQSRDELEREALVAWGHEPTDGDLSFRSLKEWRLWVPLILIASVGIALLQLTTGQRYPSFLLPVLFGILALLLWPRVWRGISPSFGAIGKLGILLPLGTAVAAVIAWRPYDTFSQQVGVSPGRLGLEWHSILLPTTPLLLAILVLAALAALFALVVAEAFSDPCRAGSVHRWRTGGRVAASLAFIGVLVGAWSVAGRAGESSGREVMTHLRPPGKSIWLRGLDVRLVRLNSVGPDACTVTPGPTPPAALLLGDDGRQLQLLLGRPSETRLARQPVSSVAVCDSQSI